MERSGNAGCGDLPRNGVSGIVRCPSLYRHCIFNEPGMVPRPRHCTPIAFSMTRPSRWGLSARVGTDGVVGDGRQSNCPDLSPKGSRTDWTERQKAFQLSDPQAENRQSVRSVTAEFAPGLGRTILPPPVGPGLCAMRFYRWRMDPIVVAPGRNVRSISTRVAPRFPLC